MAREASKAGQAEQAKGGTVSDKTQAGQDHECAACGGTGYDPKVAEGCSAPYTHDTYCLCHDAKCSICHGSGRISDVMPVSDALADAETLWMNARIPGCGPSTFRFLRAADENAEWAVALMFGTDACPPFDCGPEVYAVDAARAAFRAVPGLRG